MQQSEILSLAERLISAYYSADLEYLLGQLTQGESPSVKLLVKMELNRIMTPCYKSVDLRGRVNGECREYEIEGITHWLDDVAFNAYHKSIRKYGSYTEGVWEALNNTRNNFRVMQQRGTPQKEVDTKSSFFDADPIKLGYDLKRLENRMRISTQIEIHLANKQQVVHGLSVDLSTSGARFKVPSFFDYKLGEIITVRFVELFKEYEISGLDAQIEYRILAVDESYDNDAIKFLRVLRLSETDAIDRVIAESLSNNRKKATHDNQDKIIRARTRAYEHAYLKHSCSLPLFFSGNELKIALITENNLPLWQYWHDERNQQALGTLFSEQRMATLTKPGIHDSNNVLYAFKHEYKDKTLFFSMMMPEAKPDERKLFWHIGAKRDSWKVFRLWMFELSTDERRALASHSEELSQRSRNLTHFGILQEISDLQSAHDYLFVDKPDLSSKAINPFCHPRKVHGMPMGVYFDARSRRKEPRYHFRTPLTLIDSEGKRYSGFTVDMSKRGLSVIVEEPISMKVQDKITIDFDELKLYDKDLPLDSVPYQLIRLSPEGRRVQLMLEETSSTMKIIAFFNSVIEHNRDKLLQKPEILPSLELLESLHNILLDKMVSSPIFVDKSTRNLRPKVIGVNYPLPRHIEFLAKLGQENKISLEPIFKGHTNTLLANPMKRIDGVEPQFNELYISILKFGNRVKSIETRLLNEFESTQQRIEFIRNAQNMGEIFVLRIASAPIFDAFTTLLRQDLDELAQISMPNATALEKEITALAGYGEIVDVTDEVIMRLQLN
ncbi:PilZ domain-containing protein [Vibrio porteresiae]|uniref:PilZ domain-containing protein n=1 Tax=Vibrio porteresiae DSM 19223 TaxID=1123496 RepID=A0ABZ0QE69_9VIBR|nr:PilZ domain-containing protein [Vibrio porteresiae]WPC74680.1 PilZ domain-containing protein [Vibrio porteresiae DSM 19223]